ncbi:P44/Msp2 family outer membrane protein, partial [Anaplasma phagocytophilum]|uniref:P44/Msp2 family outer membrane protein n=1 Tax=Anaplasma phagocytophilum TaxID=948 RepID=UPI000A85695A
MRSFGHSVLCWSLGGVIMPLLVLMASYDAMARQGDYFYVGLDYSPALSRIKDFSIKRSNSGSGGLYPYIKDGKGISFRSDKFDWNAPVYTLGF